MKHKSSEGQHYGEGLNNLLSVETERLNDVNAKRNCHYANYRKCIEEGKTRKAGSILKNNLGKIEYTKAFEIKGDVVEPKKLIYA